MGLWPLTAAHRGNDIINNCNSIEYPPSSGIVSPSIGPTGAGMAGLSIEGTMLQMTSDDCKSTTQADDISFSMFVRAQSTAGMPVLEWLEKDSLGTGPIGVHFWLNFGGDNKALLQSYSGNINLALPTHDYQFYSMNIDRTRQSTSLKVNGVTIGATAYTSSNPTQTFGGFLLGGRATTSARLTANVA